MGWPLTDKPQSTALLVRTSHFELRSDNLSICNVRLSWSFVSTISSLQWSPKFPSSRSSVIFPSTPLTAITEKENSLCHRRKFGFGSNPPLCPTEAQSLWPLCSFLPSMSMAITTQDYDPIITKSSKVKLHHIFSHMYRIVILPRTSVGKPWKLWKIYCGTLRSYFAFSHLSEF